MKRILMTGILLVFILLLVAEPHDNSEYDVYYEYAQEPTTENFVKAYEYYSAHGDETGRILLMYMHQNEQDRLMDEFDSEIDSLSLKTRFSYANLLLDSGRYEKSIGIYDGLNAASPGWACPWRHKGEALWKLGDLESAEDALQKSIDVRENHYDAYVMLAEVQYEAGRAAEALQTLEKGLKYRAENPEYSEDNEFEKQVNELHEKLKLEVGK